MKMYQYVIWYKIYLARLRIITLVFHLNYFNSTNQDLSDYYFNTWTLVYCISQWICMFPESCFPAHCSLQSFSAGWFSSCLNYCNQCRTGFILGLRCRNEYISNIAPSCVDNLSVSRRWIIPKFMRFRVSYSNRRQLVAVTTAQLRA